MFRFLVLFAIIGATLAVEPLGVQFLVTDDISKLDIDVGEVTPLDASVSPKGVIRYTLGNRVGGDRLVAQGGDSRTWGTPQNIQLTLRYPQQGNGASVTYVEIVVNQNSSVGRAYVADGGIGRPYILIVVEAQGVTSFSYNAGIWGR